MVDIKKDDDLARHSPTLSTLAYTLYLADSSWIGAEDNRKSPICPAPTFKCPGPAPISDRA